MESFWILGSIAFALMLGAMSPGPTSIYVAKNSIAISRKHGLFTALGTGLGAAIFGLLAVLGLQAFLLAGVVKADDLIESGSIDTRLGLVAKMLREDPLYFGFSPGEEWDLLPRQTRILIALLYEQATCQHILSA